MVIIVGNGFKKLSLNPGQKLFTFYIALGKI